MDEYIVTETAYGKVIGRRASARLRDAEATARTWASQNAGTVTVTRGESL